VGAELFYVDGQTLRSSESLFAIFRTRLSMANFGAHFLQMS